MCLHAKLVAIIKFFLTLPERVGLIVRARAATGWIVVAVQDGEDQVRYEGSGHACG